jgi:hypothetical protein
VKHHFHLGETVAAKALVMEYHYSHRWPSNVQVVGTWHEDGGLFGDSGEAVAACVFSIPPTRWSVPLLELIRLVRRDDFTGSLSGLVSETGRWCAKKGHDLLVSYADATQGHHGGIYQACSWNYDGQRAATMDGVVIDGVLVPGRTANGLYGTRSPSRLAERGITAEAHWDEGKHLYWRAFGRHGSRKAQSLGLRSTPYPKPAPVAA